MCKFIVAYSIVNKTIVTKITKIIKTTITKTTKITKIIITTTTVRISEDHTNQASALWHLGLSWEPLFSLFQLAKYRTDIKLIDNAIFAMGCLNIPTKVKTGRRMYDY
ncbi:hypothetical protein A0O28_0076450 [Trichoderma guizhouense]|uniref:Uncharacterized protein n=1 Tax=Trichoderma guizhouense TaxID=1491466 RepID=A0A1T3CWR6_9HYPO|nr:hypothetical protein A0O28_0076450 [Trichoderma guizhouense]